MGEYSKAFEFHEKDLQITKMILSTYHSDLAFPYMYFRRIYRSMKDYSK